MQDQEVHGMNDEHDLAQANTALVVAQFDAFARGDLQGALSMLADDVDWQAPVSRATVVPWAGLREGRAAVANWFQILAEHVNPEPFTGLKFTALGDRVVVEGSNAGTARATGRRYEHDWVMVFTVRDGQIRRFRHYYDPADIAIALA